MTRLGKVTVDSIRAGVRRRVPVKKVTVVRGVVNAERRAWRSLRVHEDECQFCVNDGGYEGAPRRYERCEIGRLLIKTWISLKDLTETPSQWAVVEVIERPELA